MFRRGYWLPVIGYQVSVFCACAPAGSFGKSMTIGNWLLSSTFLHKLGFVLRLRSGWQLRMTAQDDGSAWQKRCHFILLFCNKFNRNDGLPNVFFISRLLYQFQTRYSILSMGLSTFKIVFLWLHHSRIMENQIEIFKTKDNQTEVQVRFEQETVWLDAHMIAS